MYQQAEKSLNPTRDYRKHANLWLGLFSFLLLIVGVGLRANRLNDVGNIVLISSIVLGGVHWIWSVIDVMRDYNAEKARQNKNIIWVILVIIVAPVGGILYYAFNKNVRM